MQGMEVKREKHNPGRKIPSFPNFENTLSQFSN